MPIPKDYPVNSDELYWNQPEDQRGELIDGTLYDMAPPSITHQRIVTRLSHAFQAHVANMGWSCEVLVAPVAVRLELETTDWVEPDILVVCDPAKLSDRGCEGAPDLVVEVASPATYRRDYIVKLGRYLQAGVREYWIVNPTTRQTAVYRFDDPQQSPLQTYAFDAAVPVGIWSSSPTVTIADLLG